MTQCPRCGGQVFQEYEYDLIFGWLDKCLQCGEEKGETHEMLVQFHYKKVPVGRLRKEDRNGKMSLLKNHSSWR